MNRCCENASSNVVCLPSGQRIEWLIRLPDAVPGQDQDPSKETIVAPGGIDSGDSDDDSDIIHVPEDPASQTIYHQHAAAAYAIAAAPSKSEQQPCVVCGGEHKFDGCTVLSDAKFLKEHCIRYRQHQDRWPVKWVPRKMQKDRLKGSVDKEKDY